jgi:sirohydrochlorin cobaltochelatase
MRAIVLFAHGARDPAWATPINAIANVVAAQLPDVPVAVAFLELMAPSLETVVGEHVARGVNTIDVYPLFLAAGGHLKRDLPELAAMLMATNAGLAIRLHPPIGELAPVQAAIAGAVASIARESCTPNSTN